MADKKSKLYILVFILLCFVVLSLYFFLKKPVKNLTPSGKSYSQIKEDNKDSYEMGEEFEKIDKYLDKSLPLSTAFKIDDNSYSVEEIKKFLKDSGTMDFKDKYKEKIQLINQCIRRHVLLYSAKKEMKIDSAKIDNEVEYQRKIDFTDSFFAKNVDEAVVPEEQDILEYFEKHRTEFIKMEKVNLSHIVVSQKELADSLYERIIQGESFEILAKEFSTDSTSVQGGLIGFVSTTKLASPFSEIIKPMLTGEVSTPVKSEFGYRILKLNGREYSFFTFEEARPTCETEVRKELSKELFAKMMKNLREEYEVKINMEVVNKVDFSRTIPEGLTGNEILANIKGNDFTVNEWYQRLSRNPDKSLKALSEESMDKEKYLSDLVEQKIVVMRGELRTVYQDQDREKDTEESYLMNQFVESYKKKHPQIYESEDSSEEERRKYYELFKSKYFVPHQYTLVMIKKDTIEEITPIYERIINGEDFDLIAEENADTEHSGKTLKIFKKNLAKELVSEIDKLSPNKTSPIISAPDGFYVVKLLENQPEYQRTYKDVERDLMKVIPTRRRSQHFEMFVEELKEKYNLRIQPAIFDNLEEFDILTTGNLSKNNN